ncbi:MAG TPA: hypothetical protein VFA18_02360 [Gemmataceae bacterium]|nr:hypothetical protein [Gemmataceae bacterium]
MFARKYWILPAAVVLFLGGCGLQDYQSRMAFEQERVKYEERENQLLGPPIRFADRQEVKHPEKEPPKTETPKKKKKHDKDEGPLTPKLFLRLPANIKTLGHEVAPEAQLFRFPATHPNAAGLQEVCVGEGYADDKKFIPAVKHEASQIWGTGEFKLRQSRTEQTPLEGPMLQFERYEATADATVINAAGQEEHPFRYKYTLYLHKSRDMVVAIVLRQASAKGATDSQTEEAITYSLRTLAVGPDMAAAKKRYRAH